MALYIVSIFLSALLLFQVQPLMGKLLLPWFGGAPAVWSALLLFFQVMLTGGYAYAYWLIGLRERSTQRKVHITVIGVSVAILFALLFVWPSSITPGVEWKPTEIWNPLLQIFGLLAVSVGLPYFVLSTNSTLVQAWYSSRFPGRSAYWLYAFSNFGSLLGLLAYPTLIEPAFDVHLQGSLWSAIYVCFAALTFVLLLGKNTPLQLRAEQDAQVAQESDTGLEERTLFEKIMWIALSATASMMLLAVTNYMTLDVAPIPFLWVISMSVYLLSFIFAFSSGKIYRRPIFSILLIASSAGVYYVLSNDDLGFVIQIAVYNIFLFSACMVAHGELYRLRPPEKNLSQFYLLVSVGGALGGLFVNLVAPVLFRYYWEFYLGWVLVFILLAVLSFLYKTLELPKPLRIVHDVLVAGATVAVVVFSINAVTDVSPNNVFFDRNFFGTVRVYYSEKRQTNSMIHGSTLHGSQFLDPEQSTRPTTYYWEGSGINLFFQNYPRPEGGAKVGILGLGAGVLSVFGQPGDEYHFYEINPMVIDLAEGKGGYFTFLSNAKADVSVIPGDARISMENELADGGSQGYDIMIFDAFSGDSIPTHLVTKEAVELYLHHLAPGGVMIFNISNRYLDLEPIVYLLAKEYGLYIGVVELNGDTDENITAQYSKWVFMSFSPNFLDLPEFRDDVDLFDDYHTDIRMWTDSYSNFFQILLSN